MPLHDPQPAAVLAKGLYQRYLALQRRRLIRWKHPRRGEYPLDQQAIRDLLWPLQIDPLEHRTLLGDVEHIAQRYRLDVFDLVAVVLADSTPTQRISRLPPADDIEVLTIKIDTLRRVLSAIEVHVNDLEYKVHSTNARPEGYWKATVWSPQELVMQLSLSRRSWERMHRRLGSDKHEVDHESGRFSTAPDTKIGQSWLRHLLPETEINSWELLPLLVHLGVWTLQQREPPGPPGELQKATKRYLRYLKQLDTEEDCAQINALRTVPSRP